MTRSGSRIIRIAVRAAVAGPLVCAVTAAVLSAQPEASPSLSTNLTASASETDRQQQRRPPPKAAVEACQSKKEGDLCSFTDPAGVRNGECLSGVENVFACRPFRGGVQSEQERESVLKQQAGQRPPSQHEVRSPRSGAGETGNKTLSPGEIKPAIPITRPDSGHHATPEQVSPVAATGEPPSRSQARPASISGMIGNLWAYCGVAIFSALLTWYGFFRSSTIPLRRLRKVTQQLAGGDLSARVGEGLVHRKDEVADLARDVDRMAERIESLVGAHQRLIRDVSHELRSPLARLNVALELARQSAGMEHSAPFDRIERESERLNELIGQLLMLTKLESDSGMNQREELDISVLIKEVTQDVDFEARSKDRRVILKGSESLMLNGNRELLRQALENLIRNAARYTEAETEVEITLKRKESGGRRWAHIEVRDHGPGVPESVLYDIFRPFYRVSDSRERQSGGTGVGLAISDRAVRLHGGSLRAFNAPGGGLIMEMELPLV